MEFDKRIFGILAFVALMTLGLFFDTALADGQTSDWYDRWYDRIVTWFTKPAIGAILVGVILAFVVPQRVKMDFPLRWNRAKRRRRTRYVSFISGFTGTMLMWPIGWSWSTMLPLDIYGVMIGGFVTAIIVGAAAPLTYAILMKQLYKRGILNEQKWSGDARANQKNAKLTDEQRRRIIADASEETVVAARKEKKE